MKLTLSLPLIAGLVALVFIVAALRGLEDPAAPVTEAPVRVARAAD